MAGDEKYEYRGDGFDRLRREDMIATMFMNKPAASSLYRLVALTLSALGITLMLLYTDCKNIVKENN